MSNCADCGLSFAEIKNHLLLQSKVADIEVWAEHIYSWTMDSERQIGTFNGMKKVVNHDIENSVADTKTPLPDDLSQLLDLSVCGRSFYYTGASASFRNSCNCGCSDDCQCVKWFQNGCYIQTSHKIEKITISYLAMPIDEEGFPYVRKNHLEAIIAYVKWMMLQSRFDEGKIPQFVYNTRKQEWYSKRDAARARDEVPTDGEMEAISAIYNSKLPVHYSRALNNSGMI